MLLCQCGPRSHALTWMLAGSSGPWLSTMARQDGLGQQSNEDMTSNTREQGSMLRLKTTWNLIWYMRKSFERAHMWAFKYRAVNGIALLRSPGFCCQFLVKNSSSREEGKDKWDLWNVVFWHSMGCDRLW